MTMRSRVESNDAGFTRRLDVRAVIADPDRRSVYLWPKNSPMEWHDPDPTGATEPEYPEGMTPYLQMSEDAARALYEALAERFGGTSHDTRALRRDYDAERARVDKLTDVVTAIAAGFTGPATS